MSLFLLNRHKLQLAIVKHLLQGISV